MAEGVTPPPPGFELEIGEPPPPPPGFVLEKPAAPKEAPKEDDPGFMRRAFQTIRGMSPSLAGGLAGGAAGTAIAPGAGTLVGEMLGSGGGEWLAQKLGWSEPSTGGILLAGAAPGVGKAIKPAYTLAKDFAVASFAGRPLISEAAESLLKKWINPATSATDLYAAAEATRKVIPATNAARAVDGLLKDEIGRMPLPQQKELLDVLGPIKDFVTTGRGRGFQMIRSQNVADAMADVRRLSGAAREAFSGRTPNTDLGNAINKVRAALLDDLEKAGVPEVKAASKAYRKEMAIEEIGRMLGKSEPGTKIRDFARDNPLFRNTFDPKEVELIDKITKKVQFTVPTGMAGAAGRILTGGGGMAATGSPWGMLIGLAGPEAIRKMLASPKGQAFIEKTLASEYTYGPEWAAAAAMFARGLMAQPPEQ